MSAGTTEMDLPGIGQDAEALATPLFPAHHPSEPGNCTWPPRFRYEPVPDDRTALRRLVDEADVINAHGRVWLLIACPAPLFDYLCELDAASEDGDPGERSDLKAPRAREGIGAASPVEPGWMPTPLEQSALSQNRAVGGRFGLRATAGSSPRSFARIRFSSSIRGDSG